MSSGAATGGGRLQLPDPSGLSGSVLLVAGEASGDHLAAGLVRAVRSVAPSLSFFGMGGFEMERVGVEILHDLRDLSVMGLAEVAGSLRRAWWTYRSLRTTLDSRRPSAVILVDFPEFNLRLAKAARRRGIPVLFFVSPQVWAWRSGRVRRIARDVDRVLCILPFEVGFYRRNGARAVFVGHPLVDEAPITLHREEARRACGLPADGRVLALLPGSRRQESRLLLPDFLDAARRLAIDPGLSGVVLPVATTLRDGDILNAARGEAQLVGVQLVRGRFFEALAASDAALVASGTATLAAALMHTPTVIGYRVHPLTYAIAGPLARIQHVGLVNLVAGRRVVPELIQDDFSGENLSRSARRLLTSPDAAAKQRHAFDAVRAKLGPPGVFPRAAEAVVATLLNRGARVPRRDH